MIYTLIFHSKLTQSKKRLLTNPKNRSETPKPQTKERVPPPNIVTPNIPTKNRFLPLQNSMNESDTLTNRENIDSTSTSVRVTTELNEKHAHANEVIAVLAFESVHRVKRRCVFSLEHQSPSKTSCEPSVSWFAVYRMCNETVTWSPARLWLAAIDFQKGEQQSRSGSDKNRRNRLQ